MKRGFRSREAGARSRATRYDVGSDIRAVRSAGLREFDLRNRQSVADERVEAAREKLRHVDVSALQAELDAALFEQASIAKELVTLQERATLAASDKPRLGRKAGRADPEAVATELQAH
jgi:hypothetical protein